ncbi:neutral zinc metallopeptidase [Tersicoccus sp. Bi-70]|uniref:KPN_02809 family neutral zinc metallopeptidase n=1 Tax=Tersicoccus sp. Bi-70 TaxID=1897634 RepID=UPI000976F687|nr:neutral zinc metallopeptidase [Tersicoccus sp. Bi-70]OMH33053.1 hypothetical protein BGP79_05690 [Tersicoccus sp. Bi-70]
MSFDAGSQLDPSQVSDSRGGGGGIGRGGLVAGGGIGGLVIALIAVMLGLNPGDIEGTNNAPAQDQPSAVSSSLSSCQTGQQANQRSDCRVVATVNSLNQFWAAYLPKYDVNYTRPKAQLFTNRVSTGCGTASSSTGPFYCPTDKTAYFDLSFFSLLQQQFDTKGGPLAEEYVVAHEFGHHIQDLLGTLDYAQRDPQGAESGAVRVELQADCYAGLWARHASSDQNSGPVSLDPISQQQLAQALDAAGKIGDDKIQTKAQGYTQPETYTHGTGEQRQRWFTTGYQTGDITRCDTLRASQL